MQAIQTRYIGPTTTRYMLRLSARNVRGTVQLPHVHTLVSARALAELWRRDLGGRWTVEVVDEKGEVQHGS